MRETPAMRSPVVALSFLVTLFLGACHPLACWHPADLPKDQPLVFQSNEDWPKDEVQVDVDDLGIPHIYGKSEADLAYALGVMHARDRLFQIYTYVHAGEGRLTEILGEDLLEIDRKNRVLMFGVDELLAALEPKDREIVDAYCAGLNHGAKDVGRSAEMSILGVDWEPVTARDVLAVVRLQQWDQSVGFSEEMTRYRLVKALGARSSTRASTSRSCGPRSSSRTTARACSRRSGAWRSRRTSTTPPPRCRTPRRPR